VGYDPAALDNRKAETTLNRQFVILHLISVMPRARAKLAIVPHVLGQTVLERIGNTPLLRIERITRDLNAQVLAKAEWVNPGGSVKDRAAANIVAEAVRTGKLAAGKTLLDATSGNTGIAYAMLGAARGFPVTLCLPSNVSPERKRILHAYGAEMIFTDPGEGTDGAIRKARELASAAPERYFYADQYSNDANWRAHYHTTANEIWRQTEGRITHFVAVLGTSGTFIGTARRLKELNPHIRCISLQPDSPFHGIEGAKHMPTSMVPRIYDAGVADCNFGVSTEQAYGMVKRLAREEGLLVGISAAAAMAGCVRVATGLSGNAAVAFAGAGEGAGSEAVIVTIFADAADKYLSERFWEEF
jgi:cysteine synthase B